MKLRRLGQWLDRHAIALALAALVLAIAVPALVRWWEGRRAAVPPAAGRTAPRPE